MNTLCSLVILNRFVLVIIIILTTVLGGVAQNTKEPLPLRSVLSLIEKRLNVSFTFADETVENIYLAPAPDTFNIDKTLIYLRNNSSLNFHQLDGRFIAISTNILAYINVCGYLVDGADSTKLAGATVQADNQFAVSDNNGYFSMQKVPAKSIIYLRLLGYHSRSINATVALEKANLCQTITLIPQATQLQEVMVETYIATGIKKQFNGTLVVHSADLGILPGLIEPDVLQTLQVLPGIQSINETVSHINVRGGTNDQNLVLWNGIKMYQTGHFFGLISAFNPHVNQKNTLIRNGTSAAQNDGVSSTIDIRSEHKLAADFSGGAGLNMINADVFLKIPISNKLSLQVSSRRSFTDVIKSASFNKYFERVFVNTDVTKTFSTNSDTTFNSDENFYFYDVGANLIYKISDKDKLQINILSIFNDLDYKENIRSNNLVNSKNSSLKQKNLAAGIHYNRLWNNHLSTSMQLQLSSYNLHAVNFDVLNDQRLIQENKVLDIGLKIDALWRINNNWDVYSGYQFNEVGIGNLEDINNPQFRRFIKKVIRLHAFFSELNYSSKSNKTKVRIGARANYFPVFNRLIIEPRFAFNHQFIPALSLEILGEFKSQTASQIIDLQNDFLGVEKRRWVLANEADIPIVQSKQISAGLHFTENKLLLSLDGFYKHVSGIISSSQGFQNQFQYVRTSGSYNVKGIEFLVNKQFDNFSTWLGYSFTDNQYDFTAFDPTIFANNLDITHTATLGTSVRLNHFELSAGVNWHTGKPYTLPEGIVNQEIVYQSPNGAHLPNYLRIDFSARYNFELSKGINAQVGGSIWNLTNNQNTINIYSQIDNKDEVQQIQAFALGITPNIMFRVNF